jgi:hypothetical protein
MQEGIYEVQLFTSELSYLYGMMLSLRSRLPTVLLPAHNNIMDKIWAALDLKMDRQEFDQKLKQMLDMVNPTKEGE